MAVTITQQPTSPNAAYTRLPYVVSGSVTVNNPQYQYVMDIYESGSSDLITRITQTKNPAGVAVFEPSKVFQGELSQDDYWQVAGASGSVNNSKTFEIKFGEQYGTSPSSSVTVYPNLITSEIEILPAVVDPNNGISYNWQSGSFLPSTQVGDIELTNDPLLVDTNDRGPGQEIVFKPIGTDDWETISYLNEEVGYIDYDIIIYQGIKNIAYKQRTLTYNPDSPVMYLGVGPQNLIDEDPTLGASFLSDWTHYEVKLRRGPGRSFSTYYVNEAIQPTVINKILFFGDRIKTYLQPVQNREKVRFAFINEYGVWDYYTIFNPVRRQSNTTKQNVTLPQVDYSSISSPYNVNNRGEKTYYTDTKDRFSIDTPLLDKEMANWLEEMLQSPSVYVVRDDKFIPIIVTNTNYEVNTHQARQKLFKYDIEFEPSNQPYGEWVPEFVTQECVDILFYYSLEQCPFGPATFRTNQTIADITLNVDDRVTTGTGTYKVTGIITEAVVDNYTNVGNVTDTGDTGCPTIIGYTINKCEDHSELNLDSNNFEDLQLYDGVKYLSGSSTHCGFIVDYLVTGSYTGSFDYAVLDQVAHCSVPVECPDHYVNFTTTVSSSTYNGESVWYDRIQHYFATPGVPLQSASLLENFYGYGKITSDFLVTDSASVPTTTNFINTVSLDPYSGSALLGQKTLVWAGDFSASGEIYTDGNSVGTYTTLNNNASVCDDGFTPIQYSYQTFYTNYANVLTASVHFEHNVDPQNYILQQCSTKRSDIIASEKDYAYKTFFRTQKVVDSIYGDCVVIGKGYPTDGDYLTAGTTTPATGGEVATSTCGWPLIQPQPAADGGGRYGYLVSSPEQSGSFNGESAMGSELNTIMYCNTDSYYGTNIGVQWYSDSAMTVPFNGGGRWYSVGKYGDRYGKHSTRVGTDGITLQNHNDCNRLEQPIPPTYYLIGQCNPDGTNTAGWQTSEDTGSFGGASTSQRFEDTEGSLYTRIGTTTDYDQTIIDVNKVEGLGCPLPYYYVFTRCLDGVKKRSSFYTFEQDIPLNTRIKEGGVDGYISYYTVTDTTISPALPIIN